MTSGAIEEFFLRLRSDENHHLGLGDVRLTLGQQDKLIDLVRELHRDREGLLNMLLTPPVKLGEGVTAKSAGVAMSNYVLKRITE